MKLCWHGSRSENEGDRCTQPARWRSPLTNGLWCDRHKGRDDVEVANDVQPNDK